MSFYAELKRRNVLRAAAFYSAMAWLLVQVATQVFPFFHVPEWVVRWVVVAAVVGFPFATALAWFYEWTPQGIQRESEVSPDASIARQTGRKLDLGIIVVLTLAVVILLADKLILHRDVDAAPERSIAVLPLINESGNPGNEYFSDGLSEELIAALAQIPNLKVIGRSSSFRFRHSDESSKSIGAKLGVATLLEGTVRREGRRVRIVVELVNAMDGRELWAQTYDRELKDIFEVQSEIAQGVADSLKVTLPGSLHLITKHHVPNFDTYDHYLFGLQLLIHNKYAGFATAVDAFRQAIAMDPDYAQAYAGLAMAESFAVEDNPNPVEVAVAHRRARVAAERAVALDPQLGDAYAARGYLRAVNDWNWNGALADLQEALRLDPKDARNQLRYGYLLATLGRLQEASAAFSNGIDEDPLFPPIWYWLGRVQAAQGDYAGARRAMRRVLAIDPEFEDAASYLGTLSLLQGDATTAQTIFAKLGRPTGAAMAEHDLGRPVSSKLALEQFIAKHAQDRAYAIATAYAWSNNPDQAFAWLERAVVQHDSSLVAIKYDPLLCGLHADPRFNQLLAKLGLPLSTRPSS
ncbi:MAG: tetratricopeptide repeat protein [Rhodanobacteraceae bacterium]